MSTTIEYLNISVPSNAYEAELVLRERVLRHPLGLKLISEDIVHDDQQLHIGAFSGTQLIGCVLITDVKDAPFTFQVRQMAIYENYQGKGIGRELMIRAEQAIKDRQGQRIILEARKNAQGFYRSLNYQATSDEFIHKTIPHILMEREINSSKHVNQEVLGR